MCVCISKEVHDSFYTHLYSVLIQYNPPSFSPSTTSIFNYMASLLLVSCWDRECNKVMDITWLEIKLLFRNEHYYHQLPTALGQKTLEEGQTVIYCSCKITNKYASASPMPGNITFQRSLFCLFVCFLVWFFASILHVSGALKYTVYGFILLDVYSHTIPHTRRCVSAFVYLCVTVCTFTQGYVHMPFCQRRRVYPSFSVHFLEIMTAISSSQWLMTGRTNR